MKPIIGIVDYGINNLANVCQALHYHGAKHHIIEQAEQIGHCDKLILPGVGAFAAAMAKLQAKNIDSAIYDFVTSGKPLLGICLGMQLLLDSSQEFGNHRGLSLIPGEVKPITTEPTIKIPHIAWSQLQLRRDTPLLTGLTANNHVYFVHSFAAHPQNPEHILAQTDYYRFTINALIQRDNIWGCQFHPEKSGPVGLQILANYLQL